jgi:hypothetical protein
MERNLTGNIHDIDNSNLGFVRLKFNDNKRSLKSPDYNGVIYIKEVGNLYISLWFKEKKLK